MKIEDDNCGHNHLSSLYCVKIHSLIIVTEVEGSCDDSGLSTSLACSIHFKVFIFKESEECIPNIHETEQKPLSSGHRLQTRLQFNNCYQA